MNGLSAWVGTIIWYNSIVLFCLDPRLEMFKHRVMVSSAYCVPTYVRFWESKLICEFSKFILMVVEIINYALHYVVLMSRPALMITIIKGRTACGVIGTKETHNYSNKTVIISTHEHTYTSNLSWYPCMQYTLLTIAYTKLEYSLQHELGGEGLIPLPLPVWGGARQLLQPSRRRTLGRSTAGEQT